MNNPYKILVVDDDLPLRIMLSDYLSGEGFYVKAVANPLEMDEALSQQSYNLAVIDLMLPNEDGLSICRRLFEKFNGQMGILILTAKGEDVDRIIGLEVGADDYLSKPFNPRELVARIRAILRRVNHNGESSKQQNSKLICFGDYQLNTETRHLTKSGHTVELTSGEFELLTILAGRPNQLLSRDMLTTLARGRESGPYERSVDVLISRLRKTIEPDPKNPNFIRTVWGRGYIFVPSTEEF